MVPRGLGEVTGSLFTGIIHFSLCNCDEHSNNIILGFLFASSLFNGIVATLMFTRVKIQLCSCVLF